MTACLSSGKKHLTPHCRKSRLGLRTGGADKSVASVFSPAFFVPLSANLRFLTEAYSRQPRRRYPEVYQKIFSRLVSLGSKSQIVLRGPALVAMAFDLRLDGRVCLQPFGVGLEYRARVGSQIVTVKVKINFLQRTGGRSCRSLTCPKSLEAGLAGACRSRRFGSALFGIARRRRALRIRHRRRAGGDRQNRRQQQSQAQPFRYPSPLFSPSLIPFAPPWMMSKLVPFSQGSCQTKVVGMSRSCVRASRSRRARQF